MGDTVIIWLINAVIYVTSQPHHRTKNQHLHLYPISSDFDPGSSNAKLETKTASQEWLVKIPIHWQHWLPYTVCTVYEL